MQNKDDFKKYITSLNDEFQEVLGGGFYSINTGEYFTKTEVKKYIQKKIEAYNIETLEQRNTVLRENDIEVDQHLINKRSKTKISKVRLKDRYEGGDFNIIYRNRIEEVDNMKLNNNEKLTYYVLRDFIQYPTNCIVIKDKIPSMPELEPIVGLSERTIRKSLKSLAEKGLVKLIQSGHKKAIYINPEYYASGKDLNIETLRLFNLIDYDDDKVNDYIKNNGYK